MGDRVTYKRLGDYIREVNVRNRDLAVTRLLGLSVSKEFIQSIANTIGTDMATYKVVEKGQFVYIADTSRRGDKIAIALMVEDIAIVSQAYTVFEVIDRDKLLPEYLMMWFRRAEFDRYARFKSHGSAREIFDWDELCDIELPIPTIEVQREIVAEYEVLSRRIAINEQLCERLEATATALHRKMFIDNIDSENLPEGWRIGSIGELCDSISKTHSVKKGKLIFLNTSDILAGEILINDYSIVEDMPGQAKKTFEKGDILFSEIRPANNRYAFVRVSGDDYVVSTKLMVLRMTQSKISNIRLYHYLTMRITLDELHKEADGASGTFPQITFDGNLRNRPILIADDTTEKVWGLLLKSYYRFIWNKIDENKNLHTLQSLLLSKLAIN